MTTRYEFGYGDGDVFRRRMRGVEEMHRQVAQEQQRLPDEDQQRMRYESDYYGFRGAGRRGGGGEEGRSPRGRPRRGGAAPRHGR